MKPAKPLGFIAFALIIFITNIGFAQQELLFRVKYSPNKTYVSDMVNDIKMEMDVAGDTAKRNQMLAKGMQMPMHVDMLQEMTLTTQTGALTADKRTPLTISYDKVGMKMNMAGREIKQPDKLVGLKIKGYATEDGKLKVDSIEGTSAEMRVAMEKMISQLMNAVQFPDKPMKPGDTFTQEMPMVMPAVGKTMNLLIKATYTLKEIKRDQAFFDFTQNITIDLTTNQANSTITGSGAGKMIYSIPANYITETTSNMTMNMTMHSGEMDMKMNATAKSSVKARIL